MTGKAGLISVDHAVLALTTVGGTIVGGMIVGGMIVGMTTAMMKTRHGSVHQIDSDNVLFGYVL